MVLPEDLTSSLEKIANQLRIHSIEATTAAGSGHPTSCCSAADLVAAIFFSGVMKFSPSDPHNPLNDRFILSKGHAAPLLYAAWAEAGHFPVSELLNLRKSDSPLEGHPTPRLDFVDVATGSLGQGLACGLGMAIESRLSHLGFKTFVLMGDGEMAEGSVWEAASLAAVRKLSSLVAIVDVNRLGQSQATAFGDHAEVYRARFEAFGWNTVTLDGHNIPAILEAFTNIGKDPRPLALIARTIKGKGIPELEDQLGWHGKPLPEEMAQRAVKHLETVSASAQSLSLHKLVRGESQGGLRSIKNTYMRKNNKPIFSSQPVYKKDAPVATREAFGRALARLGADDERIVVLDGDVENSTYTKDFMQKFPERFFECFIAEQTMVGAASGLAALGRIAFVATFSAFFTRAFDQVRVGAGISQLNLKLVGTHSGCSIGEDGPSQMGLEDIAMMRTVPGSVVLSPSDAVSTERLIEKMIEHQGFCYMRTARAVTPILYGDVKFEIGGARILHALDPQANQRATVVATGITVPEALRAAEILGEQRISLCVIDAYSIKPLARELILNAARETGNRLITVEDHYSEGGLGDAVAGELSQEGVQVKKLAVMRLPHSGKEKELLAEFAIDAAAIVEAVRAHLAQATLSESKRLPAA